ncbi:MAG TPA: TolC family protein, partial [Opitutaceae bacterium]
SGDGGGAAPSAPGGGAGLAGSGGAPLGPQSPFGNGGLPGVTTQLFQAGFDASWEIDIFGGTRREIQYANAEVQVAEEAERAVLVSLMGEVATTYIQLRTTQHRLQIARENLQAQREILSISQAKFKAGFQTELDVARQTAEVATTEATIPPQEAAERTLIHSLAFTIGVESDSLSDELGVVANLPKIPLEVPVGVPSDILRRRADVRQAERQLAAANAMVGVATAGLFPRFSLTGSAGLDSSKFADLPRWSSHYYSIIPGVSWPILDWGKVRANISVQNEAQKQAFTAYESTVAQALRDVEDALVKYRTEQVRRASLEDAVKAVNNAFTIARQQFEHGLADSTVVLDAQRSLLSSQDQLAESEGAIRADLVSLYKALGGGWDS